MMPSEAIVHLQFPSHVGCVCDVVSRDISPELSPLDGWHWHADQAVVEEQVTVVVVGGCIMRVLVYHEAVI